MDNSRDGRALTPATGTIDYFRRDVSREWVVVASLPNPAVWHAAKSLLDGVGIISRMGGSTHEAETDLLVLSTEAEWARDVLGKGIPGLVGLAQPTGGFPVIVGSNRGGSPSGAAPNPIADESGVAIAAVPVGRPSLSRRQHVRYSWIVALFWLVLITLIALLLVPFLFSLVQ
jgi:hypothetical protein